MSLTPLRDVTLRDGSKLEIRLGLRGLREMQPALEVLLATSDFPDLDIIYRLMTQTQDDGSIQRHFFGYRDGKLVAFLKYDASKRVPYLCSLGYVFTAEEVRGLGIAQNLCQAAIDDFAQMGGRAAYLSGSPPGNRVYQRVGFKTFNDHIMRCVIGGDDRAFDPFYFAGRPVTTIRNLTWADWATAAVLYGQPTQTHIRDYGIKLYSGEGQEIQRFQSVPPLFMRAQEAGTGFAKVAEDTLGHLVAAATLRGQPDKSALVDFLIHPTAQSVASRLIKELLSSARAAGYSKITAKIAAADAEKKNLCQATGARQISEKTEPTGENRTGPVLEFQFPAMT